MPQYLDKKKLLIYAHYYYPDVASTGQILKELAEGMLDVFDITVICVVPSYIGSVTEYYKSKKYHFDNIDGVSIIRVRVPEFDKSDKRSRIMNILSYLFRAMWATTKVGKIDYVYSISQPPIIGGLLGIWGKVLKFAKSVYNIQDFNPEQILATGYNKNTVVLYIMMLLDKWSCRCANKVILVGRDMETTLVKRFNNKNVPDYSVINNWIDEEKVYPLGKDNLGVIEFLDNYELNGKYIIMYSGNLGLYYDLINILKTISEIPQNVKTNDGREVRFVFVGSGSIKSDLEKIKNDLQLNNVVFIPYQEKEKLNYSLNAADVHWCVSAKSIKGVSVPSKIYGCMATAKPILGVLEVGSEARLIIEQTDCGLVCEPGNYESIKRNIMWFVNNSNTLETYKMGDNGRKYLEEFLKMTISINRYIQEILTC